MPTPMKAFLSTSRRWPIGWAHARRKFFDLARLQNSPVAIETIHRIDALFAIESEINGASPERRLAVRQERSRPLMAELGKLDAREPRQTVTQERDRKGHR